MGRGTAPGDNALIAERNCPKSSHRLRTEASRVHETGRRSPISLLWELWEAKVKAPEATLDLFRTVSEGVFSETELPIRGVLGNSVVDSAGSWKSICPEYKAKRPGVKYPGSS